MIVRQFLPRLCLATVLMAGPGLGVAFAQGEDMAALRAAAESYISSPGQQAMIDRLLSPETVVEQVRSSSPDLPPELVVEIGTIASEELVTVREPLEDAMVEAAAETFTLDELQALDAFYRTPEGLGVLDKMQPFMAAAMSLVGPELQAAQQRIMQRGMAAMGAEN
ncbi:DUF2059 domain-containing protein [Pseudoruegeria sp. SK021]|uniref:DUF2059 domain-containing protein n=1 Tax=Pseudoruegeria sp. SK021 TaxID=1933035 RepID=UPI000A22A1EE|nr:DUF2059 domain-containing protein [Pseudoruegeria sp. SK021]OSP56602.1 hypothetical protein BV911_01185 [Pseudoruegeria sp. SK021]